MVTHGHQLLCWFSGSKQPLGEESILLLEQSLGRLALRWGLDWTSDVTPGLSPCPMLRVTGRLRTASDSDDPVELPLGGWVVAAIGLCSRSLLLVTLLLGDTTPKGVLSPGPSPWDMGVVGGPKELSKSTDSSCWKLHNPIFLIQRGQLMIDRGKDPDEGLLFHPQRARIQAEMWTCRESLGKLFAAFCLPSIGFSSSSINRRSRLTVSSLRSILFKSSCLRAGSCNSNRQRFRKRSKKSLSTDDGSHTRRAQKWSGQGLSGQKQNFSWEVLSSSCNSTQRCLYLLMSKAGCSLAHR